MIKTKKNENVLLRSFGMFVDVVASCKEYTNVRSVVLIAPHNQHWSNIDNGTMAPKLLRLTFLAPLYFGMAPTLLENLWMFDL